MSLQHVAVSPKPAGETVVPIYLGSGPGLPRTKWGVAGGRLRTLDTKGNYYTKDPNGRPGWFGYGWMPGGIDMAKANVRGTSPNASCKQPANSKLTYQVVHTCGPDSAVERQLLHSGEKKKKSNNKKSVVDVLSNGLARVLNGLRLPTRY